MTEPTASRAVPGPHRPAPVPPPLPAPGAPPGPADEMPTRASAAEDAGAAPGLAGLGEVPVAEHVAVFEAEHARLQRELGTIDSL